MAEYIKMDWNLPTAEERVEKVKEIIANTPPENLTPKYLDTLAKYITDPITKEEKKEKYILTENQLVTIRKRETSFEGLAGKLENGEDGIYNMIANDKNILFQPKSPISEKDLEEIPPLKALYEAIQEVEKEFAGTRGMRAYKLKKQIIEMRKDQYEIRKAYKQPVYSTNLIKAAAQIDLSEKITLIDGGEGGVISSGLINIYNPAHISSILSNWEKLKDTTYNKLNSDMRWLLIDLEKIIDKALQDYPIYRDILNYKIDGKTNAEIQTLIYNDHGVKYSPEYISSLWKKKIPKLIVEQATDDYLYWYFTFQEKGKWKKCNRCGQIKLGMNRYFSKNSASKDHLYSICKECRNKKKGVK